MAIQSSPSARSRKRCQVLGARCQEKLARRPVPGRERVAVLGPSERVAVPARGGLEDFWKKSQRPSRLTRRGFAQNLSCPCSGGGCQAAANLVHHIGSQERF